MRRLEYTATAFGTGLFQVRRFSLLVGKTILAVYKDGIGMTKITATTDPFAPLPTGKHATFNPDTGTLAVPSKFEPGEITVILYQDIP